MAHPNQPEEYMDHVRPLHIEAPSVQDEVEELLQLSVLREAAGDYTADAQSLKNSIIRRRQRGLILSFSAMVFVSLGNKIMQKLETVPMYNYPGFLNIYTTFVYIPISFAYIIPMIRFGSAITTEQRKVPKKVFAVIGFLDAVAGMMQIFAATYLSGPLVILLVQSAIPISMVISKRLLNSRYSVTQYLGSLSVAIGIFIVLAPSLYNGNANGSFLWSFVMILSCIPMALSSVYKEIALGETELDPIYLNGWVGIFQFLICLPLVIPANLVADPPVMPQHLLENFWDGMKCYVGVDSIVEGLHPDNCWPGSPLYVNLYLIFNVGYNILIILLLKYGSANILFLAMTITVPLGNVAFALPFMPSSTPLKSTDVWGLFVIMSGLVLYRFGSSLLPCFPKAHSKIEDDDAKERRRPLLDIRDEHTDGSTENLKKRVSFLDEFGNDLDSLEENNPFFDGVSRNGKNNLGKPLEYEM